MELFIRRRGNGLYVLLSLFRATAPSVQTVNKHSSCQLFIAGHYPHLIHMSGSFSFVIEQLVVFYPAFVSVNLSRGPPESE